MFNDLLRDVKKDKMKKVETGKSVNVAQQKTHQEEKN